MRVCSFCAYFPNMPRRGAISGLRCVRAWLSHALLVAFLFKALIPAGFMPEFSGGDGGTFKIVICTAQGPKVVTAHEDGTPDTAAKHMGEPCALSGLAALTLPAMVATVALPGPASRVSGPLPLAVSLPPVRAGPAHGPRAPPFLV